MIKQYRPIHLVGPRAGMFCRKKPIVVAVQLACQMMQWEWKLKNG